MNNHVSVAEIVDIVRRRKKFFIMPFLVITVVSVVGAFLLPKRYESYTTILLQKDQTLNPLVEWGRAVSIAMEDGGALGFFNEIIFSRTTIRSMLDSIGRMPEENTAAGWDGMIDGTRKRIGSELRGNESFRISFADSDPFVAQRAVTALCNLFIQTSLRSDKQQAEETVRYLEEKVEELKKEFATTQKDFVGGEISRLANAPSEMTSLQSSYDDMQKEVTALELKLTQQERVLMQINEFKGNLDDPITVSRLAALDPDGTLSYSDTLKSLSVRYNQLLTRYTPRYPQVQTMRKQLSDLLDKFGEALDAEIQNNRAKRSSFVNQRESTKRDMSVSLTYKEIKSGRTADYIRLKDILDGAQQKLLQAKAQKELVDRGASKYVILDPPQVPSEPTKPKKGIIISGGSALGLIVGLAAMFIVEFYDPTIRRKRDIEVFNKPIIGYLP